jgi:hypothetical protein
MRQLTFALTCCGIAFGRVPAVDHADDARRAQHGVPVGIRLPQPGRGRSVRRRLQHGPHVAADRRLDQLRHRFEIGTGHRIQFDGKAVVAEPCKRGAEPHDRVACLRKRAVPARVAHLQREVLVDLLAGLNLQGDRLAIGVQVAGCTLVDRECCVEHFRSRLHQPAHAVEETGTGRFLAAGQRQLDAATRRITLLSGSESCYR